MNQARSICTALSGSFDRRFFLRGGAGSELFSSSSSSSSSASTSSFSLSDPAAAAAAAAARDLAREPFGFLPDQNVLHRHMVIHPRSPAFALSVLRLVGMLSVDCT